MMNANAANFNPNHGGGGGGGGDGGGVRSGYDGTDNSAGSGNYYHPSPISSLPYDTNYSQSYNYQQQQQQQQSQHASGYGTGPPPPLPLSASRMMGGGGVNQYNQQQEQPYHYSSSSSSFTPYHPPPSNLGMSQDQMLSQEQGAAAAAAGGGGAEWCSVTNDNTDYNYTHDPNTIPTQQHPTLHGNDELQQQQQQQQQQPGNYYPTTTSLHSFQPHVRGAPISSLSYDPHMKLLYVASHTVPLLSSPSASRRAGPNKSNAITLSSAAANASSSSSSSPSSSLSVSSAISNRASLVAVHSTTDGALCGAIPAHREAPPSILDDLSLSLFGSTGKYPKNSHMIHSPAAAAATPPGVLPSFGSGGGHAKLPRHAYRPPFQSFTATVPLSSSSSSSSLHHPTHPHLMNTPPPQYHRMGITSIIPTTTTSSNKNQNVITTISPNGIRIHSNGALLLAENDDLKGMICGTIHPNNNNNNNSNGTNTNIATHVTVGGMDISKYTSSTTTTAAAATEKGKRKNSNNSQQSRKSNKSTTMKGQLHCLDIQRELQLVSSHTIQHTSSSSSSSDGSHKKDVAISHLQTNWFRNNLVAGCTDGTIRLFDGSLRSGGGGGIGEVAKVKTQFGGGVAKVSVSEDGNLICASGYGSLSLPTAETPYAFSSEHVLLFDVRKLGRGAIVQPFSGVRGGPRFVQFIPGDERNRLIVGSGLSGGDLEIITPFEQQQQPGGGGLTSSSLFVQPNLNPGETVTDICVAGKDLAIGTSLCNVFQYRRMDFEKTMHRHAPTTASAPATSSTLEQRKALDMPPYSPPPSDLPIDPSVLQRSDYYYNTRFPSSSPPSLPHENRAAMSSLFNEFVLQTEPKLTFDDNEEETMPLQTKPSSSSIAYPPNHAINVPSRRLLSQNLKKAISKDVHDFVASVPTSELNLDLLSAGVGNSTRHKTTSNNCRAHVLNPNKLLFSTKISAICYDVNADPRRTAKNRWRSGSGGGVENHSNDLENTDQGNPEKITIPRRYRYTNRPPFVNPNNFDYARYNDTDLWPGWDYPPAMPNAYASPVLLALYFIPEVRAAILRAQYSGKLFSSPSFSSSQSQTLVMMENSRKDGREEVVLSAELGFLFHQIECLSTNAMNHPDSFADSTGKVNCAQVGAFVPSKFLTAFASLPEAAALALIDGSAAAVEIARRPEAFYRFLVQYIDREFSRSEVSTGGQEYDESNQTIELNAEQNHQCIEVTPDPCEKVIDSLQGLNFTSVNEFITGCGPPTVSSTRNLTVDLAYDPYIKQKNESNSHPSFGEVLRYSLCKESRLRAWCESTRSYETIVQRKIATSLPAMLSLSCTCAGKKGIQEGLSLWQNEQCPSWLPEMIEVELEESGNVIVREYDTMIGDWKIFSRETPLPLSVSEALSSVSGGDSICSFPQKRRYKLQAVISFIRNNAGLVEDIEKSQSKDDGLPREGHHVVHIRVPSRYASRTFDHQKKNLKKCASLADSLSSNVVPSDSSSVPSGSSPFYWTLTSKIPRESLEERCCIVDQKITDLLGSHEDGDRDEWVLANGFVVTKTTADDARTFDVNFKEPCLVFFRDEHTLLENDQELADHCYVMDNASIKKADSPSMSIPTSVMYTQSISNGMDSMFSRFSSSDLPGEGDLVAIDAEFVRVQHEESIITETGSKKIINEGRNALARLSIIDCRTGNVIVDDYVLPREPILDYLTRFSGIHKSDLAPSESPHHLVTLRDAYLKLRLLVDRGCIFVGHGLSQDFFTVNIFVPRSQIIDTVEIFHREKDRYISLRFLANYLLGHDMQQDIHDSIEDAKAAYEIYLKAIDLKKHSIFEKTLTEIYDLGRRTAWKLGVEDVDTP